MAEYLIKLRSDGSVGKVDCGNHKLVSGDEVLVLAEFGQELGSVVSEDCFEEEAAMSLADKEARKLEFIRKLTEADEKLAEKLSAEAKTYLIECQNTIEKFDLPMELLDADLSFDEKKLTFYFTAPSRVDFRQLVSELARTFKKIIRLQQIGARDEARYIGGTGRCGQPICCKRFLTGNLESVTLDMAAEQNLAQMGSNRCTGVCGKLMCCLKYELEYYKETKKLLPKIGEKIKTAKGVGEVVNHNVPKKSVLVRINDSHEIVEVSC